MTDLSAITSVTVSARTVFGNKRIAMGYITLGDGSYTVPAAGLSLTAAQLGWGGIDLILFEPKSGAYYYDYTNAKILVAGTGAGDNTKFNVAGGGVIPASGETVRFLAIGYGG
jgi:hypothetical protein